MARFRRERRMDRNKIGFCEQRRRAARRSSALALQTFRLSRRGDQYRMRISKPRARRATAWPMRPPPRSGQWSCRRLPCPRDSPIANRESDPCAQVGHPRTIRRATISMSPKFDIGRRLGDDRGHHRYRDAAAGCFHHIDVVRSDGLRGNGTQVRIGCDDAPINAVMEQGEWMWQRRTRRSAPSSKECGSDQD